ncbi:MAG TPA: recombinase family protein, partial [Dehalococcoidia bacterium]|nr:recombinase family protein [Dehalococcoidia bacterium]
MSGNNKRADPVWAAIYARVSTEEQAERQTIQTQLSACREFCRHHGWEIVGEYCDDGVSGSVPFANRPQGARLLEKARMGGISLVVVARLDRLSRDVVDALVTYRRLQALKVEVKSLSESFDDSPAGQFTLTVMSGVAQLEKALITERTKSGRRRIAGEGKYAGGAIPLGYVLRPSDLKYVPYEPHAAVVREVFRLYLELGSHMAVAKRLPPVPAFDPELAPGMEFRPSPSWYRNQGNAAPMTARWVRKIISNAVYLGKRCFGSVVVDAAHDPIIDADTFTAAQAIDQ